MQKKTDKKKMLQLYITDFAIGIGWDGKKDIWNKEWQKLWCRISQLKLFVEDK